MQMQNKCKTNTNAKHALAVWSKEEVDYLHLCQVFAPGTKVVIIIIIIILILIMILQFIANITP